MGWPELGGLLVGIEVYKKYIPKVHYLEGQNKYFFSDSVSGNTKLSTTSSPLHFISRTIFLTKHGKNVCSFLHAHSNYTKLILVLKEYMFCGKEQSA
jgi:hypothetical protein